MTISYTAEVATCKNSVALLSYYLGGAGVSTNMFGWDICLFMFIYYTLNVSYRFLMDESSKTAFENIVMYCNDYVNLIPLSFVLGFFVNLIMSRWWEQYLAIPWPDTLAVFVSVHVHGLDERGRVMRRTVMRYACLCQAIVFTMIAPRVKQRFPTLDHLVDAGLMFDNEREIMQDMSNSFPKHPLHWMPIVWAASIITRARKEGRIRDDLAVRSIINELNKFRAQCGSLLFYDFINVPLVYTQVVTLAVYTYFLCSVVGQQWIDTQVEKHSHSVLDAYVPFFSIVQFLCYMGWLKVAEILINPWGDDDDDFEVNWMIDRNLQMSYLIVDEMHNEHPELVRDQYWDEVFPNELPYANEQLYTRSEPPEHSTNKIAITNTRSTLYSNRLSATDMDGEKNSKVKSYLKELSKTRQNTDADKLSAGGSDNSLEEEMLTVIARPKDDESTKRVHMKKIFEKLQIPASVQKQHTKEKNDNGEEEEEEEEGSKTSVMSDKLEEIDGNEFEKLKLERERERVERNRQNYVRTLEALALDGEVGSGSESRESKLVRPLTNVTFADHESWHDIASSSIVKDADKHQEEEEEEKEVGGILKLAVPLPFRDVAVQTQPTDDDNDDDDDDDDEEEEESDEMSDDSIIYETDDGSTGHVKSSRSAEI